MEVRVRRSGGAIGCGPGADGDDPGRTAFGDAGDQPADRALRAARGADRSAGEALRGGGVEDADDSEEEKGVRRQESECGGATALLSADFWLLELVQFLRILPHHHAG